MLTRISYRTGRPLLSGALLLFSFSLLTAQRLQWQAGIGTNYSEAFFSGGSLSEGKTLVHYDTIGSVQFGTAFNLKVHQNIHVRLEGNYKAFRTSFFTEEVVNGSLRYLQGNLWKELTTLSLLPEYRFQPVTTNNNFSLPVYAFGGLIVSLERKKNYAGYDYDVFGPRPLISDVSEVKPDPAFGWSVGAGINLKNKRLGLMLEARYSRTAAVQEMILLPKISYEHFTLLVGLTVDVLPD